ALATIGGALSDERWLDELSALNFGLIQGLICGLFVHVLFHQPHDHHIRGLLLDGADEKKLLGDPLGGAQPFSPATSHQWWKRSLPELLGALIASGAFFFYHESGYGGAQEEHSAVVRFLTFSLLWAPTLWIGLSIVYSRFSSRSSV
ncbi:MAG: hypothetical protein VYD19_01175, partial [Myxococcota bacterium]|nr:hypothetical protein [Myxococcota bacterium]